MCPHEEPLLKILHITAAKRLSWWMSFDYMLYSEHLLRVEALKVYFLNHCGQSRVPSSDKPDELTSASLKSLQTENCSSYTTGITCCREHNFKRSFRTEFLAILHTSIALMFIYRSLYTDLLLHS
jgi:hypothetical protein